MVNKRNQDEFNRLTSAVHTFTACDDYSMSPEFLPKLDDQHERRSAKFDSLQAAVYIKHQLYTLAALAFCEWQRCSLAYTTTA